MFVSLKQYFSMITLSIVFCLFLTTPEVIGFKNLNVVNHHRQSPLSCPCQDTSLCQSIPRAKGYTKLAYSPNPANWKFYDYSKITELVICYDVSKMDPQLICTAHKNNVQIHLMAIFSYPTYVNITKREGWINDQISLLRENYLDGINIDYEEPRKPEWVPDLVDLVGNLSEKMKIASPNYQLTYCIYSFPMKNLELYYSSTVHTVVDYFMIMAYDDAYSIEADECYATANQSPRKTLDGLTEHLKRDLPHSKIVMGMPWCGFLYTCVNLTKEGRCSLSACNDYVPAHESDRTKIYNEYMTNSSYNTEFGWDYATLSPYITITLKNSANSTKQDIKQFWYDNGHSLKEKSLIYKNYQIRGVGAFQVDCTSYTVPELQEVTKQYWDFFTAFDN